MTGKWIANAPLGGRIVNDSTGRLYDSYVSSDFELPTPLFAFGFGLSYTTWIYEDIKIKTLQPADIMNSDATNFDAGQTLFEVNVQVKNTGNLSGTEIVQVP